MAIIDYLQFLTVTRQSQSTLLSFYQGWMNCVQALLASRQPASYQNTASPEQAAARRQALANCERLEAEISRLRAQAARG
jgi:hypothetical protein